MDELRAFLERNTTAFLVVFTISAIANLLQIYGFWAERRRHKIEEARQKEEESRLKVYEFLFEAAERNIKTDKELLDLQQEITRRADTIPELEKRIELLRLAARREIAEQNIERTISELRASMDRYTMLQQESRSLGSLPTLPEAERKRIALEVEQGTRTPYQLPISVTYRALLLVVIIILLPSPADTIMVALLFGAFMTTFFEVLAHNPDDRLKVWANQHWKTLGFVSAFGVWFNVLNSAETYLGRPLDLITSLFRSLAQAMLFKYGSGLSDLILEVILSTSYLWQGLLFVIMSLFIARAHWRRIAPEVEVVLSRSR